MTATVNMIFRGGLGEALSDHLEPPEGWDEEDAVDEIIDEMEDEEAEDFDFGSPDDDTEELETDRIWSKEYA